ncbi:MAG: hypothetical protein COA42_12190 [Alteromonadaceae bacterium]|nr:MAG: hypothetical protein COA42_12190 [Alteromonadaceae bacterium]
MSDKPQKDEEIFWTAVEDIIALANERAEQEGLGVVNGALQQAAAHFNAFYLAVSSESREDLIEDKDQVIQDFCASYKRTLATSLEDYIENYDAQIKSD